MSTPSDNKGIPVKINFCKLDWKTIIKKNDKGWDQDLQARLLALQALPGTTDQQMRNMIESYNRIHPKGSKMLPHLPGFKVKRGSIFRRSGSVSQYIWERQVGLIDPPTKD